MALEFMKKVASDFSEDDCPSMAAALAYYTAFALPPLLIVIVSIAGSVWDPAQVSSAIETQVGGLVGGDSAAQIREMLHSSENSEGSLATKIIGFCALLFGATGVFAQIQHSLNTAWEVKPDPEQGGVWNFITKRLLSLGMLLGVVFLLFVSMAASAAITAVDAQIAALLPGTLSEGAAFVIDIVASLALSTVLFALMFKILPDAEVAWSDVWLGALFTAGLFVLGKFALGYYLGSSDVTSGFGAAGSFALILLWVYYSSMILLFGAEFTQVWAKERGKGLEPAKGAVKVNQEETVESRGRDVAGGTARPA